MVTNPDMSNQKWFLIRHNDIKYVLKCLLFTVFFLPASTLLGMSIPLSSNYLFVLYAIFIIIARRRIIVPSPYILFVILIYFTIFFFATILQIEYQEFFVRRIISFTLFMAIFSFMFLPIGCNQLMQFKIAILMASLIMLAPSLGFFSPSNIAVGPEAKGYFGSQRYGFMYLMAFWIVYCLKKNNNLIAVTAKYSLLLLLVLGLFLTFSRSSIAAFFVSVIIFVFHKLLVSKMSIKQKVTTLFYLFTGCSLLFTFIHTKAPYLFQFFDQRLFSIIVEQGIGGFDLSNPEASEGYRVYMLNKIMLFVANYPLTGSGYLGVWIMFPDLSGSAHNQYTDVFFRTGIIGIIIYIVFIMRILRYFYIVDEGIFFGFIAVLVYGLFHETFKLSHGGFLFSFLLAFTFRKYRF